jgi:hypothetical protein
MVNKKFFAGLIIAIAACSILVLIVATALAVKKNNPHLLRQFQRFSLIVDNQSDYDLVSVEIGVMHSDANGNAVKSGAKYWHPEVIQSGQETVIKPQLTVHREGGIYLKFTDSGGKEVNKTVCSYTESASGYSIVTIMNDQIKVEEKCRQIAKRLSDKDCLFLII